eukprot:11708144-Alexandrium_andersonii.AAC.1
MGNETKSRTRHRDHNVLELCFEARAMVDQAQGVLGLQRSNRATVGYFEITTQGGATQGGPQPT